MGFQYSALKSKVEVTGGVTLTPFVSQPNATQDVISIVHLQAVGANVEVAYTVTAGKTFYLMGVTVTSAGGVQIGYVYKNDGTTLVAYGITPADDSRVITNTSGCPIHKYTTAQDVKVKIGTNNRICLWGYEV